jgi:hypothetical protein
MDDKASMHARPSRIPDAPGSKWRVGYVCGVHASEGHGDTIQTRRGGGVIPVCGFIQHGMYTMVGCNAL